MPAYYNENDPKAAAWLRGLIRQNLIAPGDVDERSVEDVEPDDLAMYAQCHFFAGIGGWAYALRLAGWPDDRPVWTGSCPCPPFSAAGKNKTCPECGCRHLVPHVGRTGFFVCCLCGHEWLADSRHLWPEMWRLIRDGRPDSFFGEQVASRDGRTWFATVRASLEILGYAVGGSDTCAAGFGAPHLRQRLYFVADAQDSDRRRGECGAQAGIGQDQERGRGFTGGGASGPLAHPEHGGRAAGRPSGPGPEGWATQPEQRGEPCDMADAQRQGPEDAPCQDLSGEGRRGQGRETGQSRGPVSGFWSNAVWLPCRDGKSRPVEPGSFPLAHGVPARVGRLRGYGNAINPHQAAEYVRAFMGIKAEQEAI